MNHINEEQLVGYIHQTLTDADREAIDQHLVICSDCRAQLTVHEAQQRHIRHALKVELRTAQPSEAMTFPALNTKVHPANGWRVLGTFLSQSVALAGMALALISMFSGVGQFFASPPAQTSSTLPMLACFLFSIPVASNYRASRRIPSRLIVASGLTLILWLGMVAIGLYEIVVIREVLYRIYAHFWSDYWAAVVLGQWSVIVMSVLWIIFVIYTGEYHYHHINQRESWKMFGWTILIEMSVLFVALII